MNGSALVCVTVYEYVCMLHKHFHKYIPVDLVIERNTWMVKFKVNMFCVNTQSFDNKIE